MLRLPMYDPRTVAREIPGIFDSIFPQLTPGVVAHFNRSAEIDTPRAIPLAMIQKSDMQQAMLFELGCAVGEELLSKRDVEWDRCLSVAVRRQRMHFDTTAPTELSLHDQNIAMRIGDNLAHMAEELARQRDRKISISPRIPGFQWIASGNGDLSAGTTLIEVKCSRRNFMAADYRQVLMYWLLSFAASTETNGTEWEEGVLLNPRSAAIVSFRFHDLLAVISAGRTKVEILQLFSTIVGTRDMA
jgi:hypothetical protein